MRKIAALALASILTSCAEPEKTWPIEGEGYEVTPTGQIDTKVDELRLQMMGAINNDTEYRMKLESLRKNSSQITELALLCKVECSDGNKAQLEQYYNDVKGYLHEHGFSDPVIYTPRFLDDLRAAVFNQAIEPEVFLSFIPLFESCLHIADVLNPNHRSDWENILNVIQNELLTLN